MTVENQKVSSARLTKELRRRIADYVCAPSHKIKQDIHTSLAKELGERIYAAKYSASEIALMKSAPEGAFHNQNLSVGPYGGRLKLGVNKPVFARDYYSELGDSNLPRDVYDEVNRFVHDTKSLRDDFEKEVTMLIGALSGFATWRALSEGWPELWETVKHMAPTETRSTAVVLPLADLNAQFGLPRVGEGV